MTRDELREAVLNESKRTNIAIQAATGVGKSRIAIDLCAKYATENLYPLKILLVVAELAHFDNWGKEFEKWVTLPDFAGAPITIICYASLKNYRNTSWDVIIFDEAHHLNSELRLDVFSTLKSKHRIFLSATLKDSLLFRLEESCGPIYNIKMGLQDAFSSNVLPEPKIVLIPLKLDNVKQDQIIIEEWGKKDKQKCAECSYAERWKYLRQKKAIPNGKLTIWCTQQQKYDYLCTQFEYYKKRYMFSRNEALKNKWLQCGNKRKQYLGLLKTEFAKELLKKVKDKRFICFCTNIEQAETLGGANAIHSKKKNSLDIIEQFNNKERKSLFAVGMLQEGINLNDIEAGIIVQLDGEERAFIQKFGRTLRADYPVQYIIYFKGTRDEEYLNKALENIDTNYIEEANINEYFNK